MENRTPQKRVDNLSEREVEILRLIATGTSNKEIAQQLFISTNTVKVHLRNIFAKIGVSTRTEAAVYAIQAGLSSLSENISEEPATQQKTTSLVGDQSRKRKTFRILIYVIVSLIFLSIVAYLFLNVRSLRSRNNPISGDVTQTIRTPVTIQRWQELAPMPTARSGLAVVTYDGEIYAIGGESDQGVTGVMESFDVASNSWTTLSSKPVPVTDINAVVIGGKIFIPGGLLASGEVTDIVESYDPNDGQWATHTPLPEGISGYTLAAFEGKLYLFGGWDGNQFLASTYEYNPEADTWDMRSPMPTARAYAGAVVAGGQLYVLGGYDGESALAANEEYMPNSDTWIERSALPAGRYAMGVTSIADIIYVVGGTGKSNYDLPPLQYSYQQGQWKALENPNLQSWSNFGLVPFQTRLYAMGGQLNGQPTPQNLSYQAIYTISIPVLP